MSRWIYFLLIGFFGLNGYPGWAAFASVILTVSFATELYESLQEAKNPDDLTEAMTPTGDPQSISK